MIRHPSWVHRRRPNLSATNGTNGTEAIALDQSHSHHLATRTYSQSIHRSYQTQSRTRGSVEVCSVSQLTTRRRYHLQLIHLGTACRPLTTEASYPEVVSIHSTLPINSKYNLRKFRLRNQGTLSSATSSDNIKSAGAPMIAGSRVSRCVWSLATGFSISEDSRGMSVRGDDDG
jgi:hypothetical protein